MACTIDLSQLPSLAGCPADNEWFLVGNATGGLDVNGNYTVGYGRRTYSALVNCIVGKIFGVGTEVITGAQLNGSNQYINAGMIGSLDVFYNGLNRFLLRGSEWDYVTNGISILLPGSYTSADYFVIIPNPIAS